MSFGLEAYERAEFIICERVISITYKENYIK